MLALSDVTAGYGSVPAVRDISIAVGEGEAVGLLGANGAGKSTTLRAISGLVRVSTGTITFLGRNIGSLPPWGNRVSVIGSERWLRIRSRDQRCEYHGG